MVYKCNSTQRYGYNVNSGILKSQNARYQEDTQKDLSPFACSYTVLLTTVGGWKDLYSTQVLFSSIFIFPLELGILSDQKRTCV